MSATPLDVAVPIDMHQNAINNRVVQVLASAPSSPLQGQEYFDSTLGQFGICTNATGPVWAYMGTGGGSVTSVAATVPSALLAISGTPITTSGTLAFTLVSQSANAIFAAPNGTGGTPTFRAMVAADVPKTLDHTWISDFDTEVRTSRLDQMAAPTSAVSMNGQKITNLGTPTSGTDAANKAYVDSVAQGVPLKPLAQAATTAALPSCTYANGTSGVGATLTAGSNGALTIDGYAVQTGDVVLVKNQATAAQNGLYDVTQTGNGSTPFILTRDADMDTSGEFQGALVLVNQGTTNSGSAWVCTTATPTVGTTNIVFAEFNKAADLTAGTGIAISGNTVSVSLTAGTGISVSGATISSTGNRTYSATIGDGSTTSFSITQSTHGLTASQALKVTVRNVSTGAEWLTYNTVDTSGNVTVQFTTAPTTNQFRAIIQG
ncbi:hypothetical protein [Fimbriiglobus ruber]|uniref:Phage tail fiber n=1 Tax=Fimbriiglobus ruber TaxID=1908690 RepID=A0A225DWM1_9BACT|nr:hypothetical protein [Fimbriiglobus ruber]OWK45751.1 Phage tail fiber [Fimbriiglobus ruber]